MYFCIPLARTRCILRVGYYVIVTDTIFIMYQSHVVNGHTTGSRPITALNPLTPNDPYSGLNAPLTSKRCILYIYSTNIGTEYFKHCIYSPFFSLQNAVCFIILTYLSPVLFTFYIWCALKFKKIIPAPKG